MKLDLLVTARGEPVEMFLTPGLVGDVQALGVYDFDPPAGSLIARLMPKRIHTVTSEGFELKVMLFTLAFSVWCAV